MKKNYILSSAIMLSIAFLSVSNTTQAQNIGINATGAAPDAGAMLDISSTNKGLLIPRVNITSLATIAPITGSATVSMLVYNTNATTGLGYHYWDGSQWVRLSSGDAWQITGNANTVAGTNFLGTTNAQALDFRTGNILRLRLANGYQLQANGNGSAAAPFYSWLADANIGMYRIGTDILGFSSVGLERLRLSTTSVVFNELSYNYDFRIESNSRTHMFFVDAGLNNIGINTASPSNMVNFESDGRTGWVTLWNNTSANGGLKQVNHTSASNGSRVLMGVTNYSASTNSAAAVIGLSLNATTTGTGGIGVQGSANNESGVAVYGTLAFTGGYTGWAGFFNADVGCAGIYIGSDRKLKKDISPINNALNIVNQIEPVKYYYNTEKYPGIGFDEDRLSYGFIAQDLEKIIPEMVKEKNLYLNSNEQKNTDDTQKNESELFKVVNYTLMVPILTQAVKEQQTILEAQNAKIEALEQMILELQKVIENK